MSVSLSLDYSPRATTSKPFRAPYLGDLLIIIITIVLVGFSLVMVYSTTGVATQERFGDPLYYVKRQGLAAVVGFALMFLAAKLPIERIRQASPYLFFASVLLLALTLLPGLGSTAGGARRWIDLGIARFQPGEFVKVFFVIFMAGYWARHEARLRSFLQGVVVPFLMVGLVGGLYLLQPDFGSAAIVAGVILGMALATGVRLRFMMVSFLVLALCVSILVLVSPYRLSRIVSFLSPWADASGKGYQLIQSLIAVGTGQFHGVGLGGSQQKLFFLPAAHTDFIFAVIAEELGFIGCVAVIGLFLLLLWRGLTLAGRVASDTFSFSLAVGATLLLTLPALLNIGVVIGLLPTKGLVLPLLGYGGSSLMASLMVVGILLSLSRSHHERHH